MFDEVTHHTAYDPLFLYFLHMYMRQFAYLSLRFFSFLLTRSVIKPTAPITIAVR